MSISLYSIFASFVWSSLFILTLSYLRKRLGNVLGFHLFPLILLIVLSLVRLLFPFELPFVTELHSESFLPFVVDALQVDVIITSAGNMSFAVYLVSVCSFVSVILIVQLVWMICGEYRKLKDYQQTDDLCILSIFEQVREEAPSRRKCDIKVVNEVSDPYIWGPIQPTIVLSKNILAISNKELYYVLKHEWQHHLDRDVWVKLLIEGLCRVMWWNPFVYLLQRDLNQTFELKCDAKVFKSLGDKQREFEYMDAIECVAEFYKEIKDELSRRKQVAAISLLGLWEKRNQEDEKGDKKLNKELIQRFDAMKSFHKPKKNVNVPCAICLIGAFLLSFCFVFQPFILPPEEGLQEDLTNKNIVEFYEITPETAILVDNGGETYLVFINGEYWDKIPLDSAKNEPYKFLSIITVEEGED